MGSSDASALPSKDELTKAVSDLNKSAQENNQGLEFSIDEDSKRTAFVNSSLLGKADAPLTALAVSVALAAAGVLLPAGRKPALRNAALLSALRGGTGVPPEAIESIVMMLPL